PATAGFLAKYYIVRSLIEAGHLALAWFAALAALPLAYCYLRLIVRVWRKSRQKTTAENLQPPCEQPAPSTLTFHSTSTALLGICLFVSLAAGLYPEPFTRLARYAFGQ
ncbi:MAG: hypothetical protein M3N22_05195, partial [Acidobacteriota bacterium]|nr:hypothetical protein [Acidobacteriota bacterium]